MKPQTRPDRPWPAYWLAALGVLLLAAVFRAAFVTDLPPGMIHDEVWNRANVQAVLDGHLAPYAPVGGGREALYFILQAGSVAALGENVLAMRLPSVALGLALTAITLALGARLFNRAVGLLAGLALATSFWAVLFARLAVRTISLPVAMGLVLYALHRALTDQATPRGQLLRFAGAGVALGLSLYTYPGAWGLPIFLAPLILYLALLERERMRGRWAGLALMLALAALIAVPLLVYRQNHPEAFARALQVDEPLRAALAGDLGPVLENIPLVLSMFTVEGDHGLEYNLQWRPVFPEPLMGALFYVGVALVLWRLVRSSRRLPYTMVLLMGAAMLAPTIVTEDARNPSRPIGLLAVLFVFVALGAHSLWRWVGTRWGAVGRGAAALLLAVTFGLNAYLTARDLAAWADNPVVRFLYQSDLYQIARYLDRAEDADRVPLFVAGLTPDWVDPTSLRLFMARRDLAPGFFDGQGALLVPAGDVPARVLVPDMLTLHPAVEAILAARGEAHDEDGFTRWELRGAPSDATGRPPPAGYATMPVNRAGPLATLTAAAWDQFAPGKTAHLLTIWETHARAESRLRVFVHLMDAAQVELLAQSDALDVPSLQWRPGEVFYQAHTLALPTDLPPGEYALRIGLYDPATGGRVPFDDGADAATLTVTLP